MFLTLQKQCFHSNLFTHKFDLIFLSKENIKSYFAIHFKYLIKYLKGDKYGAINPNKYEYIFLVVLTLIHLSG